MKCPIIGQLKSPTKRTCDAATTCRGRLTGLSQMVRMEVKEPFDRSRHKLGAIIHDASLANDLWDAKHPKEPVVVKIRKKVNPPMSNEWGR